MLSAGLTKSESASLLSTNMSANASLKSSSVARDRLAIILATRRASDVTEGGVSGSLRGVDLKGLQNDLMSSVKVFSFFFLVNIFFIASVFFFCTSFRSFLRTCCEYFDSFYITQSTVVL
jgi:septum formation topological specificity factor MinE